MSKNKSFGSENDPLPSAATSTNLERIGVRFDRGDGSASTNDRVTRKHYIKPPSIAAMRQLSETLSALPKPKLLPNCSPKGPEESISMAKAGWIQ